MPRWRDGDKRLSPSGETEAYVLKVVSCEGANENCGTEDFLSRPKEDTSIPYFLGSSSRGLRTLMLVMFYQAREYASKWLILVVVKSIL